MVIFFKTGCIRVKWLYLGKSGFILVMWFCSGKIAVFDQKLLYSGKGDSIQAEWLYS